MTYLASRGNAPVQGGVYVITNTPNGQQYVGSATNLRVRKQRHVWFLRKNEHHSSRLQRSWNKYGDQSFDFRVILLCEPPELLRYEQALINQLKPEYNMSPTAGNRLGMKHKPETIAKMRANHTPGHISPQCRAAQVAHLIGKPLSREHREKIGAGNRGRIRTEEHKLKISLSLIGKPISEETRKKISEKNKGRKLSREHCAAISAGKMGHTVSPETRAKLSTIFKGKKREGRHLPCQT